MHYIEGVMRMWVLLVYTLLIKLPMIINCQ
jgi:hypothetical protein